MPALHYSVMKRELSKNAKLSTFKTVFVPILTYGHESWVMTEKVQSQALAITSASILINVSSRLGKLIDKCYRSIMLG